MKILRTILLVINIILIVALLLTTFGSDVAPSTSVWPGLFAYGYLPLLALNVIMALVWLLMHRWQFLLSVAAIAVRYTMLPLFFQVSGTAKVPAAEEHPSMVTVMTHNVRLFRGAEANEAQTDSNALEFMAIVREYNPDVLCLQEYGATKRVRLTDSLMLMGFNHYYGTNTSADGLPWGTVIFSRHPITYVNRIDGDKLLAELMLDGRRFRVCNVHMDSYSLDEQDFEEIERVRHGDVKHTTGRTLAKVKETVLNHEREWNHGLKPMVEECTLPLLLAGDMNDIPGSWLYGQMSDRLADTYCDKGLGYVTTWGSGLLRVRIDMLFHSEGFRTLSYRRIRTDISDHCPVFASLELEP